MDTALNPILNARSVPGFPPLAGATELARTSSATTALIIEGVFVGYRLAASRSSRATPKSRREMVPGCRPAVVYVSLDL